MKRDIDAPDVCIVGCGPAGAVLGAALVEAGLRVTVLESGPWHSMAQRGRYQRLYLSGTDPWERTPESLDVSSTVGPVPYLLRGSRVRAVGGSSLHWGGETPRLHASDLRMRSLYGVGHDWPLGYDELEPYYVRAEHELGVAGGDDPFASPRSAPYPMQPFPYSLLDRTLLRTADRLGLRFNPVPQARNTRPYRGRSQCLTCGTCFVCPIGAKASVDLTHAPTITASPRGRVIENATVLRLETDSGERVRRAVYATLDRTEHAIEAPVFVVGGGGVETPRLLLLSAHGSFPDGLANRSGLVGRGFREHPLYWSTARVDGPTFAERTAFYTATCNQFWDAPGRDERASFSLFFSPGIDETPAQIAKASDLWGDALAAHVVREFGHTLRLESPVDMLTYDHNTIDLDPDLRDYFGRPAPRVSLSIGEYEEVAMRAAHAMHAEFFAAHGAANVEHDTRPKFMAHHGGTCRMGADRRTSVVDRDLRAHDVPNLFLLGNATFPTGGLANPTLTIVALALRLADYLVAHSRAGAV